MQGGPQEFLTAGAGLVADVLERFGRVRFRALGTSMAPRIRPGDVLDVRRASADDLAIGDVVLVRGGGGVRAHRFVARGRRGRDAWLVTRGDALWQHDAPVRAADVLGAVVRIERGAESWAVSRTCSIVDRLHGLIATGRTCATQKILRCITHGHVR